jgi:nucleoside-diphosphate-sugar epimerase
MKAVVTGGTGFIGYHLVNYLKNKGYYVVAVDILPPRYGPCMATAFVQLDLRVASNVRQALMGADEVYALAACMGGMGFISDEREQAHIIGDNTRINMNTIQTAADLGIEKYFFSSSACVYPNYLQETLDVVSMKEEDAYPADPQKSYGWEKLHTEHLCLAYNEAYSTEFHIARFENTYGECGAWRGGREKAPAALCRKVAIAKLTNNPVVDVWGDGKALRSYTYVSDIVEGIYRLMHSEHTGPINLGNERMVSVDELLFTIASVANYDVIPNYIEGPQGVRARNASNAKAKELLGWEAKVSLGDGIARTYPWIEDAVGRVLHEQL